MSDLLSPQPPGWYHGEGDPVGTQRYWNGARWVGEPRFMGPAPALDGPLGLVLAGWWVRVIATLLDAFFVGAVWLLGFFIVAFAGLMNSAVEVISVVVWVGSVIALAFYNWVFLQSWNGSTVGKRMVGLAVIKETTGARLSKTSLLGRWAIVIPMALLPFGNLLDVLWPLWDTKHQALHDKAVGSIVVRADSLPSGTIPTTWDSFRWSG